MSVFRMLLMRKISGSMTIELLPEKVLFRTEGSTSEMSVSCNAAWTVSSAAKSKDNTHN